MAVKKASPKKVEPTLGNVVMVYTKSSQAGFGLLEPKVVTIEGLQFIEGTQITGRIGHRMERKRTLVPFEHVASIIEFASEDELFSEPQSKLIRPPEEEKQSAILTSHEQSHRERQHPHNPNGPRRHRKRGGQGGGTGNGNNGPGPGPRKDDDARLQEQYDARRKRGYDR